MEKLTSEIEGCFFLKPRNQNDSRGSFVKTFAKSIYKELGISFTCEEEYYSISKKNVFRGFHFQTPPYDHDKIIYCPKGHVMDLIVDLRKNSKTFGKFISVNLKSEEPLMIYLPKGCAHGFYTYEEGSIVAYMVTTEYAPANDKGILWSSFNIHWPCSLDQLIISERDKSFPLFSDFENPF